MWWFIVTFFIGMAVGRWKLLPTALLRHTQFIVIPALSVLLLILGQEVGSKHSLMRQLPTIGFRAIVITVLAMLGSALCAVCTARFFMGSSSRPEDGGTDVKKERTS
jgi:hypothetical protein